MFRRIVEEGGAVIWRSVGGQPEILLVQAKETTDWIFPKGHIERGEGSDDAALREAREETGIVGRIVRPLCPPLEFVSGKEHVRVQYYLVAATGEQPEHERREMRWLSPDLALQTLTHPDARELLREALPDIREEAALTAAAGSAGLAQSSDAFRELLLAEYEHTADSLLRNEEDGEKRVTFFMTLTGGVGAALAFLLGHDPDLRPDAIHPLVVGTLMTVWAVGYFTLARVVHRNLASDRYKQALNRIRRYFLTGSEDPHVVFLAFDPFNRQIRRRPSWASIGRGGWLETLVLVESLISGALAAMLVPTSTWWRDGTVAAIAAFVAWVLLLRDASRRSSTKDKLKPC